jgi:2'-5' RNA ligase
VGPDLAAVDLSAVRDLYVDAITVYQSDLSPSGAEYTVLAEEALGEPEDGMFEEM